MPHRAAARVAGVSVNTVRRKRAEDASCDTSATVPHGAVAEKTQGVRAKARKAKAGRTIEEAGIPRATVMRARRESAANAAVAEKPPGVRAKARKAIAGLEPFHRDGLRVWRCANPRLHKLPNFLQGLGRQLDFRLGKAKAVVRVRFGLRLPSDLSVYGPFVD
jgi:hypothetical protein